MQNGIEVADGRLERLVSVDEAVAGIGDGATVAIGGFINSGHPMMLVRGLMRSGVRDLRLVGAASAGLEVDMLIAAGLVSEVLAPYVGAEGLASIGPAFRRCAEAGEVRVRELDEAHYYAGLRAAAQQLPFNPWLAGVGTDMPRANDHLVEFTDPIGGGRLLAVPAIAIDVALLHVARSDVYGNAQHNGTGYGDRAIFAAADHCIVQTELVVTNEAIRARPELTSIPGADAVVYAPYGAHPFSADGHYVVDETHIREYLAAADDWRRHDDYTALDAYFQRYVHGPATPSAYLETIGIHRLMELGENVRPEVIR